MHTKPRAVFLLSGCLLLFSCLLVSKKPMTTEERIVAYEAEIRTAIIEEKNTPILLGIHSGAKVPSVLRNLVFDIEEGGLIYWEWTIEEKESNAKGSAYVQQTSEGLEFPFVEELDFSKIYAGSAIRLTFLYKKPTGEWIQQLVLPGMLVDTLSPRIQEKLKQTGALRYADESIQLIDMALIEASQRSDVIVNTFEMIFMP